MQKLILGDWIPLNDYELLKYLSIKEIKSLKQQKLFTIKASSVPK